MKYNTALVVATLALSGCSTQSKFTEAGRQVRIISPAIAVSCEHLGMVAGWGPSLAGGLPYAQIDVRNKAASKGGNALVLTSQVVNGSGHAEVLGDAYRCS